MTENNQKEKIKEIVINFFGKMTFYDIFPNVEIKEDSFLVEIKTESSKILIGERGKTLLEIQHLLRMILKKELQEDLFIDIDINDYKRKKEKALQEVAEDIADEVVFYKKEKILPPMSSYERRIIHVALQNRDDVETESINQDKERRVVVKPKSLF